MKTEDAPEGGSETPSGAPKDNLVQRMKAAVLDALERARSGLSIREDNFFLLLSVIIGLFAGLAVVCFRITIDYTRLWLLGSGINPGPVRVVLVPTVCGLLLAFIVLRVFPRVRGSGVAQTKSAVYIYDGYIPFNTVIGKFLTCALAIGSGQSLGPEDPSLQMGAGIASALGRRLHLSRERVRLIAPVGAAAGLAAAFNAPISAVLFVIEEDELRRAADIEHFRLAVQLRRTLLTLDRDYLDDRRFPPAEGGGLVVLSAPHEAQLERLLKQIDRAFFQNGSHMPLAGRKLHVQADWSGELEQP